VRPAAPLRIALLAETPGLGFAVSLDRRCGPPPVRIGRQGV